MQMTETVHDIPEQALAWHRAGKGAALATVVQTWGSAPRRVGAQLAVSGAGEMRGSVSGGCVEGAVVTEALEAIATGRPKMLSFGVSDGDAFAVGLACGGEIKVLVEPVGHALPEALLADLVAARASRVPVAYVTGEGVARRLESTGHAARFRLDRSGFEEDGRTFVGIHNPPLRLIIVGAVHIAQALVPMARIAGFDPVIVDPRERFAAAARFPDERIEAEDPEDVLPRIGLDARTAVVLLSHEPRIDDPALHLALHSDCFYIGALGAKRTHAARVARLEAAGFAPDQIARVNGPIGLDIGAATPAEIAVSILSEMVQALRQV